VLVRFFFASLCLGGEDLFFSSSSLSGDIHLVFVDNDDIVSLLNAVDLLSRVVIPGCPADRKPTTALHVSKSA
jgi:hypothetical protein